MKQIKRLLQIRNAAAILSFACIASLFSSCGKSSSNDPGADEEKFLTCKLDGIQRNFNYNVNANDPPAGDLVHFVVIGGSEEEDVSRSPGFVIDMVVPEGAREQTYTVAGGLEPELDGKYYFQNFNGSQHVGTTSYMGGSNDGTNFTLTITSLTDWGVKGTFSGVLSSADGDVITVTEGRFSAPYN